MTTTGPYQVNYALSRDHSAWKTSRPYTPGALEGPALVRKMDEILLIPFRSQL